MFSLDQLQLLPPSKWQDLENLVRDLFCAEWGDKHAQRHGRQGQAQQGVDVFGRPSSVAGWAGVQCKNKDLVIRSRVTINELRQEVKKAQTFQPPLAQFIVATTAPRDSLLQLEARKITDQHSRIGQFSVHVYAWDDIVEMLAKHERVAKHYYGTVAGTISYGRQPLCTEQGLAAAFGSANKAFDDDPQAPTAPLVLPAPVAHALGILATCPLLLPDETYPRLFPEIDWKTSLEALVNAKAVIKDSDALQVPKRTKDSFLPSIADRRPYVDAWISALEPRREHVDLALVLSLQYLVRQEYAKAVDVVVDLVDGLEPGTWNDLYSLVLKSYSKPRILNRLSDEQRLHFYHACGLCLVRGVSPKDALPWVARLRRQGERMRNHWGIAQAILLSGIALEAEGQDEKAEAQFLRAAEYAKRHNLPLLVGHALHNVAMLRATSDPSDAARLLEESIRAKKQAGDEAGRVAALIGRGLLAARSGKPVQAQSWFARAEKLASQFDMRHGRSVALCNIGTALVEQGRTREALPYYKSARLIAEREGFIDTLALAVGGEAMARLEMGHFAHAHDRFLKLHELRLKMGHDEAAVVALHDAGIMLLNRKHFSEARRVLRRGLCLAQEKGLDEWIYRCQRDDALTDLKENKPENAIAVLAKYIAIEASRSPRNAALLAEDRIGVILSIDPPVDRLTQAFSSCLDLWVKVQDGAVDVVRVLGQMYDWHWSSGRFQLALEALHRMAFHANQYRLREHECRALDQLGTCLQELDRLKEAEPFHRNALRIGRQIRNEERIAFCLNNLGELLRKTGRFRQATHYLKDVEHLAVRRGDYEAAIAAMHNRALALLAAGRKRVGLRLLQRCRDRSQKRRLWREYVRALHGLGNTCWDSGKHGEAEKLLKRALWAAQKHGLPDQEWPIQVNLAGLLYRQGNLKEAIRHLTTAEPRYTLDAEGHRFHAFLATCYEDAANHSSARQCWEKALLHSRAVSDYQAVATATVSIARNLARTDSSRVALALLRKALRDEHTPGPRITLLRGQLEILLAIGQVSAAIQNLNEIQRTVKDKDVRADVVDCHMLVGDALWSKQQEHNKALEVFVAGLVQAVPLSIEAVLRVGIHIVRQLLLDNSVDRVGRIRQQEESIQAWISDQVKLPRDQQSMTILLWPFRVARRCAETSCNPLQLPEGKITRYVLEEFKGQ